jgi:hypothetical protein
MASHYTKTKRMHFTYLVYSLYTQIFTFWGDVRISILAFSLLKHQKQKKKQKKSTLIYCWLPTLRLFYAPVNLTIFNFFHLLH